MTTAFILGFVIGLVVGALAATVFIFWLVVKD